MYKKFIKLKELQRSSGYIIELNILTAIRFVAMRHSVGVMKVVAGTKVLNSPPVQHACISIVKLPWLPKKWKNIANEQLKGPVIGPRIYKSSNLMRRLEKN